MNQKPSYPGRIGGFGFSEVLNRVVPAEAVGPCKITWEIRRVKKSEAVAETRNYADRQRAAWASLIASAKPLNRI